MAISRSKVKIYMVDADDAPLTLLPADIIAGEIVTYGKTGGGSDTESVAAFGGFIDKEKPEEQYEISMEVVPNLSDATAALRWEAMKYTSDVTSIGIYTSASGTGGTAVVPGKKMIVLQAYDGTTYQSYAFNNCDVTQFELDHAADDNRTGNITFKFSPTTEDGSPNLQVGAVIATSLIAWATLEK